MRNLFRFAAAFILGLPLHATTVYIQGSFDHAFGGPLDGGSFSGSFDMTLPAPNSFVLLTTFDVVMSGPGATIEIKNGQSGSFGEVFGDQIATYGALPLQFVDNKGNSLDIYFATPFNGTGPVIVHTSKGFVADAVVGSNKFSEVAQGGAALTPIPEPSTLAAAAVSILLCGLLARFRSCGNLKNTDEQHPSHSSRR